MRAWSDCARVASRDFACESTPHHWYQCESTPHWPVCTILCSLLHLVQKVAVGASPVSSLDDQNEVRVQLQRRVAVSRPRLRSVNRQEITQEPTRVSLAKLRRQIGEGLGLVAELLGSLGGCAELLATCLDHRP